MSTSVSPPPGRSALAAQARDVFAVMAFSAATSLGLSLVVMLLLMLGRQG